jgi:hypothetical protein
LNQRKRDVLAWESRWSVRVGILTLAGVAATILSLILLSGINGENSAELLVSAHEKASTVTLGSVVEAIGFLLLIAPLYFLFRAAYKRSDRMRGQLVGVIIVAPLFFALSAVLTGISLHEASSTYVHGEAKSTKTLAKATEECKEEQEEKGTKSFGEKYEDGPTPLKDCISTERKDNEASNARGEAGLTAPATGFELAGRIGLAFALGYSCLWAMRVGLLSRFWGSLGIAFGVVALLLVPQFTVIFFIYFGLLCIGKMPRGKPPAWAAGEAVPWPSPGERIARQMDPKDGSADWDDQRDDAPGSDAEDPDAPAAELPEGVEAPEPDEAPDADEGPDPGDGPQRRKRKRRNN